jgi:hypothetical protein
MNLWVNRLRQLATLAVALFFFACEDETSFLGFKNPNQKFENYSVEIPLETSVLLLDSVRTSNFMLLNEVNRFLVGRYNDPEFGPVSSTAITQFFTLSYEKLPTGTIIFDSANLHLAYDLYFYGDENTPQTQTFHIRKVEQALDRSKRHKYIHKSTAALSEPIVSRTLEVFPKAIRERYSPAAGSNETPRPDTLTFRLPQDYSESIFNKARDYSNGTDSVFVKYEQFLALFQGLAIEPDPANTLMIGFSPGSFSQVALYYHVEGTNTRRRLMLNLSSTAHVSFNNITTDRSGSSLDGITELAPFLPASGKRYVQAGTGVLTKVSFAKFFDFTDTIGSNVIINQAQLVVEDVEENSLYTVPGGLALITLNEDNTRRFFTEARQPGSKDSLDLALFRGTVRRDFQFITLVQQIPAFLDNNNGGYVADDSGTGNFLVYNSTNKRYSGTPTLFVQELYRKRDNRLFTEFALYPVLNSGPGSLKAVNRVIFPAEKVFLRIKYTKPTIVD